MTRYPFPKRLRLLKPREFQRVLAARASDADGLLRMHGIANELDCPRLGLTVSRKVGGAVARNRWRRAIREAFRLAQHELPALDLVCTPRPEATPDVRRLVASLAKLARRIDKRLEARRRSRDDAALRRPEGIP